MRVFNTISLLCNILFKDSFWFCVKPRSHAPNTFCDDSLSKIGFSSPRNINDRYLFLSYMLVPSTSSF